MFWQGCTNRIIIPFAGDINGEFANLLGRAGEYHFRVLPHDGRGMQSAPRFGKITEPIMSLTLGTRVGPCATLATTGVGGMGEVYRAAKQP